MVRDLLSQMLRGETEDTVKTTQKKLNQLYDMFVKKYGYLSTSKNEDLFWDDPVSPLLLSLEVEDRKNKKFNKAEIFTERTIKAHKTPTSANSSVDALNISLSEYGYLNWDYVAKLMGKPEDEIVSELSGKDIIYQNPEGGEWELADEYLSGNVKAKLKHAEAAVS